MRVFISWSGAQSKEIASLLHEWLPLVLQATKPYMSERDNEAGSRWGDVLAEELHATNFGILCLTPDNIESPWINFEAGALSKALGRAHVVPMLYSLRNSDVPPPLSQFMMKNANEVGIRDIVRALNAAVDFERRVPDSALNNIFANWWPKLRDQLATVTSSSATATEVERSDRDLLEEILSFLRRTDTGVAGAHNSVPPAAHHSVHPSDDRWWFEDLKSYLRSILGQEARIDAADDVIVVKVNAHPQDVAAKIRRFPRIQSVLRMGVEMRVMRFGLDPEYVRLSHRG